MHELLAPCAFVSDSGIVLTKRGDLFAVLRLNGVDAECLEPDTIAGICQRFDGALRILTPEYRIYQYFLKRHSPELSLPHTTERLASSRAEWLGDRRSGLFSVDLYLVVLRQSPVQATMKASLLSAFSTRRMLQISRSELERQSDILAAAVHSLTIQLEATVRPEWLDRSGTLHFLRRLTNVTPWKAQVQGGIPEYHLDQCIAVSGLECWPHYLKQDGYFTNMCQ